MIGHDSILSVEPFQVFDVLSPADFNRVLQEKENMWGHYSAHKLLNFRHSEKEIGVFSKVCDKVSEILLNKGFENPKVISIDYLNHYERNGMPFHKHWDLENIPSNKRIKTLPPEYFWIAIYYPHELFDVEYSGNIDVKLSRTDLGTKFKCVPNSLILHNGLYGHAVKFEKHHPTIRRDSCFTHWVCKYDFK